MENGDEDAAADEDEVSDEEDKEVHGGAAGEQGAVDSQSHEDVEPIESIIWSLFTVKVIDYRFRFLQSIRLP